MSIENGARFIRKLREDPALRQQVLAGGSEGFLRASAEAGASASAYDVVAALAKAMDAEALERQGERKKLILMGLVEPKSEADVEAFDSWYLGNHVEDTFNCPNVKAVTCYRSERGFVGKSPAGYLTVYEFDGEDAEAAEQVLGAYQRDPNGWARRQPGNGSMAIIGAGWYSVALAFPK